MVALGRRALSVQFRRAQLLMPTFVLPLMLLAVIASGTSAAQGLDGFPDVASYLAFIVPGTIIQGALLAGLTSGTALASDIEFGFFDRLLAAPVRRTSLVIGRQAGTLGLSLLQTMFFLVVAYLFGARYPGGVEAVLATIVLAAITAIGIGGIAAAIALRTGSLSLLQSIFPFVFVLLFTARRSSRATCSRPCCATLARFNPLTYVVEAVRGLLAADSSLGDPWLGLAAAVVLALATTALATFASPGDTARARPRAPSRRHRARAGRRSLNGCCACAAPSAGDDRAGGLPARHVGAVGQAHRARRLPDGLVPVVDRAALAHAGRRVRGRGDRLQPGARHRAGLVRPTAGRAGAAADAARRADPRRDLALARARDRRAGLGLALGAELTGGVPGLSARYVASVGFCTVAGLWGIYMALTFRTQQAGPLMQQGVFLAVFLSTAYTPEVLLRGWLAEAAGLNPVTQVLQLARQATVSGIEPSLANTLPGLLALAGMFAVFGGLALFGLRRLGR